jgi:hypothetical protein
MPEGYQSLWSPSHLPADESPITLATTMKALWLPAKTLIPAGSWYPGKKWKLTAFGKATTDATAGNYVFEMAYGSGDAPTPLVAGASVAGTISQTNITWTAQGYMECRSVGTAGVVRMWGQWTPAVALVASTLSPYIFPNATPADISVDTTVGTNAITFQCQRSNAGVWTMTTTGIILEALN